MSTSVSRVLDRLGGTYNIVITSTEDDNMDPAIATHLFDDGRSLVVSESRLYKGRIIINAIPVRADGTTYNDLFIVEPFVDGKDQYNPSVASVANAQNDGNGGYFIVWEENENLNPQQTNGTGIYGAIYGDNSNLLQPTMRLNTITINDQTSPSITSLSNGQVVVVWSDAGFRNGVSGVVSDIVAQLTSSQGVLIGSNFLVNSSSVKGTNELPIISPLSDGGFVIVWQRNGNSVYAQSYNNLATKRGVTIAIGATATSNKFSPSVSGLLNGNFVLVFESEDPTTSETIVKARIYNNLGGRISPIFDVSSGSVTIPQDNEFKPAVTLLADGGFVIGWVQVDPSAVEPTNNVYARVFEADGTARTDVILLNSDVAGRQSGLALSSVSDRRFIAVWQSKLDGEPFEIQDQVFQFAPSPSSLSSLSSIESLNENNNNNNGHLSLRSISNFNHVPLLNNN
jgi:hypothetical protein